jgi:hypothetical protein
MSNNFNSFRYGITEVLCNYFSKLIGKYICVKYPTETHRGIFDSYDTDIYARPHHRGYVISILIYLKGAPATYQMEFVKSEDFNSVKELIELISSEIYLDQDMENLAQTDIYKALTSVK